MAETYHQRHKLIDGYQAMSHPLYNVWANMKARCNNKKDNAYENYGGRGITYCERWKHFENFVKDMGMKPSLEHTIDRIDNDKGYFPENCRWATRTDQCLNRRLFRNNKIGKTGVVKVLKSGRYVCRFDYENKSYKVGGTFESPEDAEKARDVLISKIMSGEDVSDMLTRPARYDNTTGTRGISKRKSGYVVRITENGKRKYLGHCKNFEDAKCLLGG